MHSVASLANPISSTDLTAFVVAVEAGSVQGAADALELTQSAVTKRIHSLERRLGDDLLERGRFGVRPTALGQTLYPQAKRALASLQELAALADVAGQQPAVNLQLVSSLTIGEFLLPTWLGEFRAAHPEVHPQLELLNTGGVLASVREGRHPIGFVEGLDVVDDLRVLPLAGDEIVVAVASGHRWARRRRLSSADLRTESYLTREAASGTRAVADAALARRGITLEPALQMASTQGLKRALSAGGFTLISRLAIEDEQRAGTLVGLPVEDLDLRRRLVAIAPMRPALKGAPRVFWQWMQARAPSIAPESS